jgi:hypothetical protein
MKSSLILHAITPCCSINLKTSLPNPPSWTFVTGCLSLRGFGAVLTSSFCRGRNEVQRSHMSLASILLVNGSDADPCVSKPTLLSARMPLTGYKPPSCSSCWLLVLKLHDFSCRRERRCWAGLYHEAKREMWIQKKSISLSVVITQHHPMPGLGRISSLAFSNFLSIREGNCTYANS